MKLSLFVSASLLVLAGCASDVEPSEADAGPDAAACDLGTDDLKSVCDCSTHMYIASVSDVCRESPDTKYLCNQVCPVK